jgi:hypothetical protein
MTRYPYYLESDDEAGEVRLMQDEICVARGKSRNALAKIRDRLNAPTPLEGSWVERTRWAHPRRIAVDEAGVAQAVFPRNDFGFMLLVRMPDGTLEEWHIGGDYPIRVVDKPSDLGRSNA